MTVATSPVDPAILQILQQTTPHIPFEEISRLVYKTCVPGRFGKTHIGRWRDQDVELRQPFGEPASIEKEVRLLHRMRHCPQLLQLHGYTVEPRTSLPFLVLQHNEHGTLHSYLLNFHAHLTWSDRYNLAMDIAFGLCYLHHKGYKHRHLHSASILIDTNGSAVLSDFGNTKDSEVISSREHTTRMAYHSPEKLSKSTMRYTFECDIYSLGMVLWEISSGRPPFEDILTPQNIQGGAMPLLAQNIVAGRRERPVKGTDPIYEDIYTRCWHPNPLERPSIDWVIQSLRVLLKQPSAAIVRQMEELGIVDEPLSYSPPTMSIKLSTSPSPDNGYESSSPLTRSRELLLSPREPDYLPPPTSMPPPIPPVSQRRKLSASPSMAPSARSMSVSSGSSNGSSGSHGPAVPARDARRVSTMQSPVAAEFPHHSPHHSPKRRSPQTIWEACQEGNGDLVEWHLLTTAVDPNAVVSLPAYSMLAEVALIHFACFYQPETLLDVLKALQRSGAKMQLVTTITRQTALHILLEHAKNYDVALEVAKYLMLECKLSVNDPDNRGLTPFHKYLKNPHLSGIVSVASSELYTLLREKGEANLSLESHHDGNAFGMTARYLRVDLMKLFLLTDLSCSEPKSMAYAASVVEAPLSESRSSKTAQDLCRTILVEWKGERGETKRMQMAERILEHQALSASSTTGLTSSPSPPSTKEKSKKQVAGLLGLGKSNKFPHDLNAGAPLSPKIASEVDVAKKLLQSSAIKQRKLKSLIADSGF
ncbi:Nuclear receptor sub 2 group C member 2 [Modicella reniformis]|uniref:Nuclear receptor sub 2 group C member 2 n=1 Tax=Modicella reniformis TaxID=1440133 RepID=A0A9P6MGD1_9FUNG|nr:Nuclear receptor sub 2 group C member 2 [Modicella reniformis]